MVLVSRSILALGLAAVVAGCGGGPPPRTETPLPRGLTGRWNDSDARLVAATVVSDLGRSEAIERYGSAVDAPVIAVVGVRNRSDEYVATETFRRALERAITVHARTESLTLDPTELPDPEEHEVEWRQRLLDAGADFALRGTIGRVDTPETWIYHVDLELLSLRTGDVMWTTSRTHHKRVDL